MREYRCHQCGKTPEQRESLEGKKVRCPRCAEVVELADDEFAGQARAKRCPACCNTEPPLWKKYRTPLGVLAEMTAVFVGLLLPAVALAVADRPAGLLVGAIVGMAVLWVGTAVLVETRLKVKRQVCPVCKRNLR